MKRSIYFTAIAVVINLYSTQLFAQKAINKKAQGNHFQKAAHLVEGDYIPKTVIVKVKAKYKNDCTVNEIKNQAALNAFFTQIGAQNFKKKFPLKESPKETKNQFGEKLVDLSLVYEFNYTQNFPLDKVINRLYALDILEYAQPHYLPKEVYTPNDPDIAQPGSYFLSIIDAFGGWDIDKGDSSVVIGVTDTGIDMVHPDLLPNMKRNYNDPVDGNDNDGDGYIDNFIGWDLGENDNNPQSGASHHGTHVSGLCGAMNDNGIGMAGTGFKCRIMPIKIMNAAGALNVAYEGIVYAADHNCKVINCSWGGTSGGQYEQDIINYATFNKGSLVVAASGNNGTNVTFYPASFDNVFSVTATNNTDTKWVQSNYGPYIDVCAPGENVYSCWQGGAYVPSSGTSMACPVAAGCAAIVKNHFPSFSPLQVAEQLRVTADNIDQIAGNVPYAGLLGRGRINLFRALSITNLPSVRITRDSLVDNNDNTFIPGDTIRMRCDFTSYLATTTNMTVTVSCSSPYVTFLDNSTTIGAVAAINTVNNNSDPYQIKIAANTPLNTNVLLKFNFTDGAFTDVQYIPVSLNVDYIDVEINDVATTITSKGRIGYNQDQQVNGLGFLYNSGTSILYESSLMVGTGPGNVSDMMRSVANQDNDFVSLNKVRIVLPSVNSEFDLEGKFNDAGAGATKLNINVEHSAYAWSTPGHRKYVIVKYSIVNAGQSTLSNLYAGICADWDIANAMNNNTDFDASRKLGYTYGTGNSPYAGVRVLSSAKPALAYGIDNIAGGAGGVDLQNGYPDNLKYTTLSTNRFQNGIAPPGTDVMQVVSTGPYTMLPNDTIEVGFALLAGDDLADIQLNSDSAQAKYDILVPIGIKETANKKLLKVYPNPANNRLVLEGYFKGESSANIVITDILGNTVLNMDKSMVDKGNQKISINTSSFVGGIYFIRIKTNEATQTIKFLVVK